MKRVTTRFATMTMTGLSILSISFALQGTLGAATPRTLVLDANGLSAVHLGASESVAYKDLLHLLDRPTVPTTRTPALELCGVSAMAWWHSFSAYFNHQRLVGLSLGPGKQPNGVTSRGLRLGNTLARARLLYGTALRTSGNNGGTWFVSSRTGRLDGFLSPSGARAQGAHPRILTIDVGVVGCPAMSP